MSFTGNTGNSTSTTANTNNNNTNNKVADVTNSTPTTPTQSIADLSANKAVDQVQKDQPNKPDSTTPVTPEAGTSQDKKKLLLESAIAIEAQIEAQQRVNQAFIELGEANTQLRELKGQYVQEIRAYQERRPQELDSATATEPVTPHSGAGRSSPQLDRVSAALETIIGHLAENERPQPPAFGTPTEGTEPSPDTIFRLHQLFEQPFAEINTATDGDPQVTALLHEFRQRWATALFNEYLVRQNKVAMQRTLEKISRSDIPRPHLRLLNTAARTIHTSGNQLDSLPHTQLGIRSGRSTQDEET